MLSFRLSDLSPAEVQNHLQHAIAPRPVCFASTIDQDGNVNLSPFSFFNLFSSNPPIVIFSPARRVRDNSVKHTLENVQQVPEVVINIVDYDMVQQTSLASCDFPKESDEFVKAGFSKEKATVVKPPMVRESKIKLECKVNEVKPLGENGGAGNLVICEVLVMHIDESILNEQGKIDQKKINHVARLGGDWYTKVDETNLFIVPKPNIKIGIGVDSLPTRIRTSKYLTGNALGMLANVDVMPVADPAFSNNDLTRIAEYYSLQLEELEAETHKLAANLLAANKVADAWQVLLFNDDAN